MISDIKSIISWMASRSNFFYFSFIDLQWFKIRYYCKTGWKYMISLTVISNLNCNDIVDMHMVKTKTTHQ